MDNVRDFIFPEDQAISIEGGHVSVTSILLFENDYCDNVVEVPS